MTGIRADVIDISHHNDVRDLKMAAASGIKGVIQEATQGRAYADPDYAKHGNMVAGAGLLWGAYDFNTGDDVRSQVHWFIDKAQPDENTLLVLDYEDNRLSNMNIHQAVDFLHLIPVTGSRKP
jgi:lysozyme